MCRVGTAAQCIPRDLDLRHAPNRFSNGVACALKPKTRKNTKNRLILYNITLCDIFKPPNAFFFKKVQVFSKERLNPGWLAVCFRRLRRNQY
jgi:hypothetical protein